MADKQKGTNQDDKKVLVPDMTEEEFAARKAAKLMKRKARKLDEPAGLKMTSLMDALTIMLVFLLVSIVSDPLSITQGEVMRLANAAAEDKPASDTIAIAITKANILTDQELAVDIECIIEGAKCTKKDMGALNLCEEDPTGDICNKKVEFKISKQDKENANPNSLVIVPLKKKLDKLVKRQIEQLEMRQNKKFEGIATLIVDKEIPFRLLTEVIYTAGRVGDPRKGGLAKFRFAVMKGQ